MNAAAWMSQLSLHGNCEQPAPTALLSNHPSPITVDQWDGTKFVERVMEWDGAQYREAGDTGIIEDAVDLDACSACGRDLDGDSHGDMCLLCFIAEGEYDAADAEYDMSVEDGK